MVSIAKITEKHIRKYPYITQAIRNNIINYSKLSRQIAEENDIKNIDPIIVACRRYFHKIQKKKDTYPIMNILKGSKLAIRNKIIAVIIESESNFKNLQILEEEITNADERLHVIKGISAITLITTEEFLKNIKNKFKNRIKSISKDLVEINMKSSNNLENVPGVMGHIYSLFAENEVNILETMSCWTDTIFVINEDDLQRTIKFLSF